MESELPNNIVPLSRHKLYVRKVHNRRVVQQTKTPPPPRQAVPATGTMTESQMNILSAIGVILADLQKESVEQRNILRELVARVCELKILVDTLSRRA